MTPPGTTPVLVVYVQPDGNLGVAGLIDNVPAVLDLLGQAMRALAQHHAKKEQPKVLAAPAGTLRILNGKPGSGA